jgi:hypothetical protein
VLFPCICVLELQLICLFQSSSLLSSPSMGLFQAQFLHL